MTKGKRKKQAKFLMLEGYVIRSAAWQALCPEERAAYLELKWAYDGLNNGRIGMGVRELALALKSSKSTARRALIGLAERGFIQTVTPSSFYRKNRLATEYRLTEYSCDVTGELPAKNFMRWEPKEKTTGSPEVRTGSPEGQSTARAVRQVG